MSLFEAFWHLFEFVYPALAMGLLCAAGAKGLWRKELSGTPWWRLAGAVALAGIAVLTIGLAVFGRDGRMLSYAALVIVSAVVLWFAGFRAGAHRSAASPRREPPLGR
jgi:ABC-type branched-subunit amino acid transport system permease subunit